MNNTSTVWGIAGPVIKTRVNFMVKMYEVVFVGDERLLGEVVRIRGDVVDIQVYENADGLAVGAPVNFSGNLLSVELGPGILGSVLDGIGRPLKVLAQKGAFLERGQSVFTLNRDKDWFFEPSVKAGDMVLPGDIIGHVQECKAILHPVIVPLFYKGGEVMETPQARNYKVDETIVTLDGGESVSMLRRWDVRRSRPVKKILPLEKPLITGQRILDSLFPLALGGAAVLPGGFGTGKTVTQQSIAKWCNADVIIYIGCGERGNEMTEVLEEFPELKDPSHDAPLMDRMVLIANTSNMPVAAREASVYLGMTIGEYYRDLGKNVAIMADSTSRWAEALREIGGRLEEMPGEEGYPAYLGTRLAEYYERAGRAVAFGTPKREGSVTVINAVSPPGGDFSEPVTQASLRLSGTFWGLDKKLAQQRHFPSINWNQSYSLYEKELRGYYSEKYSSSWQGLCSFLRERLSEEKELKNLVQLVGRDGLSEDDKWTLQFVELLKTVYLQQNAFDPLDASYTPVRQVALMTCMRNLDLLVCKKIKEGFVFENLGDVSFNRDLLSLRAYNEELLSSNFEVWLKEIEDKIDKTMVMVNDETL